MAQQTLSTTSLGTDTGPIFSVNDALQCRVAVRGDPLPTSTAPAFIRNINQTGVLLLRATPNSLFDYAALSATSGTFFVNIKDNRYELTYDSTVFGVLSAGLTAVRPPDADKPFYILKDATGSAAFSADGSWSSIQNADIHNTQWQFCIPIMSASASMFVAPVVASQPASVAPVAPAVASQPASVAPAAPVVVSQPASVASAVASQPASVASAVASQPASVAPAVVSQPASVAPAVASQPASVAPAVTAAPAPTAAIQNTDMTTIRRLQTARVYIVGYTDGFEITRQTAKDLATFFGNNLATRSLLFTANTKGLSFCFPFIYTESINGLPAFPVALSIKKKISGCPTQPGSLKILDKNTASIYYIALYGKPPEEKHKNTIIFNGQKLTIHNFTPTSYSGFTDYRRTYAAEMFEDMAAAVQEIDASTLPPSAMGPPNAKGVPPPEPGAPLSNRPVKKTNTILLTVNPAPTQSTPMNFTYDRGQGFITNLTREFAHDLTSLAGVFGLTARNRAVV
jgi:hypothetical protein